MKKDTPDAVGVASRRKLLKTLAAGGGVAVTGGSLPQSWTKPVVNSVLLPVHAVTTCAGQTCNSRFSGTGDYDGDNAEGAGYYGSLNINETCENPTEVINLTVPARIIPSGASGMTIQFKPEGSWVTLTTRPNTNLNFSFTFDDGECVSANTVTGSFSGTPFTPGSSASLSGTASECCTG